LNYALCDTRTIKTMFLRIYLCICLFENSRKQTLNILDNVDIYSKLNICVGQLDSNCGHLHTGIIYANIMLNTKLSKYKLNLICLSLSRNINFKYLRFRLQAHNFHRDHEIITRNLKNNLCRLSTLAANSNTALQVKLLFNAG